MSVQPDGPDATDKLNYALPIEGIKTPSTVHQWSIEISNNDLSSKNNCITLRLL